MCEKNVADENLEKNMNKIVKKRKLMGERY